MESLRGMAKKKKVRSPDTCPHDSGPSYSLPATMRCISWSATNSSPLCIAFYVLPCCKPLGSVVSEHGLRSLKLRVRCTDLFLTTVTFRIVLKDFHQNWFGSDCSVTICPTGGFNDEPFLLLLYHTYVGWGRDFHWVCFS